MTGPKATETRYRDYSVQARQGIQRLTMECVVCEAIPNLPMLPAQWRIFKSPAQKKVVKYVTLKGRMKVTLVLTVCTFILLLGKARTTQSQVLNMYNIICYNYAAWPSKEGDLTLCPVPVKLH